MTRVILRTLALHLSFVLLVLSGCQETFRPRLNVQLIETKVKQHNERIEVVQLDNCRGTRLKQQVVERGGNLLVNTGEEPNIGEPFQSIEKKVFEKYGTGKTIRLTAAPGTRVEFSLKWTIAEFTGIVIGEGIDGKRVTYRYYPPTTVQILEKKEIGCDGL